MRVAVLGPTQVSDTAGRLIAVGPKERVVLARLAIEIGRSVADDLLIEALWFDPPPSARKTLQGHVHRLRRVLGPHSVVRDSLGYALVGVELDIDQAENQVRLGRTHLEAHRYDEALVVLRHACELFRGPPAPELDDLVEAAAWRRRVDEIEWQALESNAQALIASGRSGDAIAELEILTSRDPTRERVWCLLVRALVTANRRADALDAITRVRKVLARELGISPGPELEDLERAILDHRLGREPPEPAVVQHRLGRDPPLAVAAAESHTGALPPALAPDDDEIPLIGRDSELGRLCLDFARVVGRGGARACLLVGEAGVGKTRLAAEAARLLHTDGAMVLFGRCTESTPVAYEPLVDALAQALDTGHLEAEVVVAVRAVLGQLSANSSLPAGTGSAEADRHRLLDALMRVFQSIARTRPVLLVIDDAHWAAGQTVAAVQHLVRHSSGTSLLIVATVRAPEFGATDVVGPIGLEPNVRVLQLNGLDPSQVQQFVAAAVPGHEAEQLSAVLLQRRTGGNPFMLGELVMAAHGGLAADAAVPDLVRAAIVRRARRLPEPAPALLRVAAVVGLEFELDLLARSSACRHDEVAAALDDAVRSQLIVEASTTRITYQFRHAIIRDAMLAEVGVAARAQIHERVAAAIEASASRHTLATASRLAYHYLSGATPEAIAAGSRYAECAGRAAVEAFANDDACQWFRRAIESSDPTDLRRSCSLQLSLARAATASAQQSVARQAAVEAWRLARLVNDGSSEISAVLLHAGEPEFNVVGDEPGRVMLAATLDLGLGSPGERSRIMARLGSGLSYTDNERATQLGLAALELARSSGDAHDVAYAIRCRLRGWFEPEAVLERLKLADELSAIGRSTADEVTESWGCRWRGAIKVEMSEPDEIEHECARLEAFGVRLHLLNHRFVVASRTTALRTAQGRFEEAAKALAVAEDLADQIDNRLVGSISRIVRATLEWLRDDTSEATIASWRRHLDDDPSIVGGIYMLPSTEPYLQRVSENPDYIYEDDLTRLWALASAALAVRRDPDDEIKRLSYPWARHHAERFATAQPACGMFGSMHLYAGLLATDADAALRHLRRAVTRNRMVGLRPYEALALHELAKRTSDVGERREASTESRRIAADVGIPWLL